MGFLRRLLSMFMTKRKSRVKFSNTLCNHSKRSRNGPTPGFDIGEIVDIVPSPTIVDNAAFEAELKSSSRKFKILRETSITEFTPLPHPIDEVIKGPLDTSSSPSRSFSVKVHGRKIHARGSPNINVSPIDITTAPSFLDIPPKLHLSPRHEIMETRQPSSSSLHRLNFLSENASFLSLLELYDEAGSISPTAFCNDPVSYLHSPNCSEVHDTVHGAIDLPSKGSAFLQQRTNDELNEHSSTFHASHAASPAPSEHLNTPLGSPFVINEYDFSAVTRPLNVNGRIHLKSPPPSSQSSSPISTSPRSSTFSPSKSALRLSSPGLLAHLFSSPRSTLSSRFHSMSREFDSDTPSPSDTGRDSNSIQPSRIGRRNSKKDSPQTYSNLSSPLDSSFPATPRSYVAPLRPIDSPGKGKDSFVPERSLFQYRGSPEISKSASSLYPIPLDDELSLDGLGLELYPIPLTNSDGHAIANSDATTSATVSSYSLAEVVEGKRLGIVLETGPAELLSMQSPSVRSNSPTGYSLEALGYFPAIPSASSAGSSSVQQTSSAAITPDQALTVERKSKPKSAARRSALRLLTNPTVRTSKNNVSSGTDTTASSDTERPCSQDINAVAVP